MARLLGPLYLTLAAAIWGGMYVISKVVLTVVPPLTLVSVRFAIALVIYAAMAGRQLKVQRKDLGLLALLGLVGYAISIGLQFAGTALSSAHSGAIITSAAPAFIALFALWILKERLTLRKTAAMLVATVGVMIIVTERVSGETAGSNPVLGNWLLLGAGLTWALYTVLSVLASRKHSTVVVNTWSTAVGFVLVAITAALTEPAVAWGDLSLNLWLGIAYLGVVSTALAFWLWVKGFALVEAGYGSLFFFVQPLSGALLGALVLGEQLTLRLLLGSLVLLGGVVLASWPQRAGAKSLAS